jgi:protein-S-isoprenylcysteine O-methyltransferase Ste14
MRPLIRLVVSTIFFGAILFLAAGTTRWPAAWAYLGLATASLVIYSVILSRLHPDLIDERLHPPADAKKWDKPFVAVVGGIGPLALMVVCALDHRFGWSPALPRAAAVAGFLVMGAGQVLINLAVAANRFFSAFVRIQRDRGHRVVDAGPYRFVRHPGYVGSLLHMAGTCLALQSLAGLGVAAALSAVLVIRTALEDRTLALELEGYAQYAERVRFRLVPGVW